MGPPDRRTKAQSSGVIRGGQEQKDLRCKEPTQATLTEERLCQGKSLEEIRTLRKLAGFGDTV